MATISSAEARLRELRAQAAATTDPSAYSLLYDIRQLLDLLLDTFIESRKNPVSWDVVVLTVKTAGQPVEGPDLPVPDGYTVIVRQRRHAGTPTGYVASKQPNLINTNSRVELGDNDSVPLGVSNTNQIYVDADTDSTSFELILEVSEG